MNLKSAKSTSSVVSAPAPFRLLIVEEDDTDALRIEQVLQQETPVADPHRARTVAEARTLLSEMVFEATLVNQELPDGDCFDVLDFILKSALQLPVVVLTRYGHEAFAVSVMKAGASDCIRKELDHRHLEGLPMRLQQAMHRHHEMQQLVEQTHRRDQMKLVETVRSTVANIKHEINNPLAIISGNAQLLLELTSLMDLDEELVKPIRDIEEASLRIGQSLEKLNRINDLVARGSLKGEEDHFIGLSN